MSMHEYELSAQLQKTTPLLPRRGHGAGIVLGTGGCHGSQVPTVHVLPAAVSAAETSPGPSCAGLFVFELSLVTFLY